MKTQEPIEIATGIKLLVSIDGTEYHGRWLIENVVGNTGHIEYSYGLVNDQEQVVLVEIWPSCTRRVTVFVDFDEFRCNADEDLPDQLWAEIEATNERAKPVLLADVDGVLIVGRWIMKNAVDENAISHSLGVTPDKRIVLLRRHTGESRSHLPLQQLAIFEDIRDFCQAYDPQDFPDPFWKTIENELLHIKTSDLGIGGDLRPK